MGNFSALRDWFCRENGISNNVLIVDFSDSDWFEQIESLRGFLSEQIDGFCTAFDIEYMMRNSYGLCYVCPNNLPGEFRSTIIVRPEKGLATIFHELVHWRQHCQGHLQTLLWEGPVVEKLWYGVSFPSSTPYNKRPWEIEARMEEDMWVKAYKEKKNAA